MDSEQGHEGKPDRFQSRRDKNDKGGQRGYSGTFQKTLRKQRCTKPSCRWIGYFHIQICRGA